MPLSIIVLIVDSDIRNLIAAILRSDGHIVLTADGREQEWRVIIEEQLIDLVIADLHIGSRQGEVIYRTIKETPTTRHIKVAFLIDTFAPGTTSHLASNLSGDAYIPMPFGREELLDVVASLNK